MEKRLVKKRIVIFVVLSFLLSAPFVLAFPEQMNRVTGWGASLMMLAPAASMFLTRLITREGFRGLWFRPRPGTGFAYCLGGWYGIIALLLLGSLLFYLLRPAYFDPTMPMRAASYQGSGEFSVSGYLTMQLITGLLVFLALPGIFSGGLGEEWGWRGYLLPKLLQLYGIIPAVLISGLIWGFWHTSLVLVEAPLLGSGIVEGILSYLYLCTVLSMIFSYVTLRSGSALPAAFMHIAYNMYSGFGVAFMAESYEGFGYTACVWGVLTVVGVWLLRRMRREEKAGRLNILPYEKPAADIAEQPMDGETLQPGIAKQS